jgi:hypothetical protein
VGSARTATIAAAVAAVLGVASAAISAYWLTGGDALLDTVGGDIERWGRDRSASVLAALAGVVIVKLVVASAALLGTGVVRAPAWTRGRIPRALCWIAAIVLAVYGGLLTFVGLLVQAGVVEPDAEADRHALAWHSWLWDPWFLAWGAAFSVALWCTRPGTDRLRRSSVGNGSM